MGMEGFPAERTQFLETIDRGKASHRSPSQKPLAQNCLCGKNIKSPELWAKHFTGVRQPVGFL